MRQWGFHDAHAAPGGPDGGIDVRASGALGQVKFRAAQVGRPDLQRLVGARGSSNARLFFFTGTSYSSRAIEFADEMGIALFTYALDGTMTPVNGTAQAIMWQPAPNGAPQQPYIPAALHAAHNYLAVRHPNLRALAINWRAALGYFCLLALLSNVVNPNNYRSGSKTAGTVAAVIILGTLTFLFLRAQWRSRRGTWPPHRRR